MMQWRNINDCGFRLQGQLWHKHISGIFQTQEWCISNVSITTCETITYFDAQYLRILICKYKHKLIENSLLWVQTLNFFPVCLGHRYIFGQNSGICVACPMSLNCLKQLRLKDNLCLSRGFSMETLCPYECDILLVRGGHLEGPHVFRFLMLAFPSEIWSQT